MRKPKLLLVEDNEIIRQEYAGSLTRAGFGVMSICDGRLMEDALVLNGFDVVLCDTGMEYLDGPEACARAKGKGLLPDEILLIGMSDDSDNQQYWRGLAHFGGFYDKDYPGDIGEMVMAHYMNFSKPSSPAWRERMPELSQ